jgi:hypothetical protein
MYIWGFERGYHSSTDGATIRDSYPGSVILRRGVSGDHSPPFGRNRRVDRRSQGCRTAAISFERRRLEWETGPSLGRPGVIVRARTGSPAACGWSRAAAPSSARTHDRGRFECRVRSLLPSAFLDRCSPLPEPLRRGDSLWRRYRYHPGTIPTVLKPVTASRADFPEREGPLLRSRDRPRSNTRQYRTASVSGRGLINHIWLYLL